MLSAATFAVAWKSGPTLANGPFFAAALIVGSWLFRVVVYFTSHLIDVDLVALFTMMDGVIAGLLAHRATRPNQAGKTYLIAIITILIIQFMLRLASEQFATSLEQVYYLRLTNNLFYILTLAIIAFASIRRIRALRRQKHQKKDETPNPPDALCAMPPAQGQSSA